MAQKNEKIEKISKKSRLLYFALAAPLLLLFFFVTYKLSHQVYKQNQINDEISELQEEINSLNQENQDLNELISYLQTDDFKEKEAKDKLNLIKEGEKLVLIKEHEMQAGEPVAAKASEAEVIVHHANYYWWWHYFFSLKGDSKN